MTDRMTWPSAPVVLADALYTEFGYGSTRLKSLEPSEFPAVTVTRIGGYNDRLIDYARVVISVYAENEDDAENLSEQIRSFLTDTRPIKGAGRLLEGATTEVAPNPAPVVDQPFYQYIGTYVVQSRRA